MATDESKILPPMMNNRQKPQPNRAVLGLLLALLFVAVVLALWFLLFDDGDSTASGADGAPVTGPTPLTLPTSTPVPEISDAAGPVAETESTTAPVAIATPVPEGFEACSDDRAPSTTTSYIVDTNTTPLNQRADPSVSAEQAGVFDPGQTGLLFTGDCVVNLADGYVWWQINNGTAEVWIASDFVTPN